MSIKFFFCSTISLFLLLPFLLGSEESREEKLKVNSAQIFEKSKRNAAFYALKENEDLKEVTQLLLASSHIGDTVKQHIRDSQRRFFVFRYPSSGIFVKGYISFVPNPGNRPLLLFLRGGNNCFGLMHPANPYSFMRDYTVISTTYRGGVSEGKDEFGGSDVDDVVNLVRFFPNLQQKLSIEGTPKKLFMLGGSRGAMQMFLALARYPDLQHSVNKIASLSGLLDLRYAVKDRADREKMYASAFGLRLGENEDEWISTRDPMIAVEKIRKDLPILILQGTDDIRVTTHESRHMVAKLQHLGHHVLYCEVPGADHDFTSHGNGVEMIADWFEDDEY